MNKNLKSKEHYQSLNWDFNIIYLDDISKYKFTLKGNDLEYFAPTYKELIDIFPQKFSEWYDDKASKEDAVINEPINVADCNSRINIKLSPSVQYHLIKESLSEGITVNQLVSNIIGSYYGIFKQPSYLSTSYNPSKTLAVVNCAGTIDEIMNNHIYACGSTGVAYSFKQFKYFGPYSQKEVSAIFEVKAVIDVEQTKKLTSDKCKIYWKNVSEDDEILINELISKLNEKNNEFSRDRKNKIEESCARIFLLNGNNFAETRFIKDTPRGLYSTKKYFNDIASDCNNAKDLAQKLNGKLWSDFKKEDITEEQE